MRGYQKSPGVLGWYDAGNWAGHDGRPCPCALYLMSARIRRWLLLLSRSTASRDAKLLVLRHEIAFLRRVQPRPGRAGYARDQGLRVHDRGCCALYVRAQPESAGLAWPQRNAPRQNQRPARPGIPISRAVSQECRRWARSNPIPYRLATIPTSMRPGTAASRLALEVGLGRGLGASGPDRRPS